MSNIIVENTSDGIKAFVKAKRILPVVVFLCVWLSFWTMGGIFAAGALMKEFAALNAQNAPAVIFLAVWLTGWFFGEATALYIILWMLFGKFIMTIAQGVLTFRYDVFLTGISRVFNINEMSAISLEGITVKFKYQGKDKKINTAMSNDEAKALLEIMKRYIGRSKFEEKEAVQ